MQTSEQRRPAIVPPDHPTQRYYSESYSSIIGSVRIEYRPSVDVFRSSNDDVAQLRVQLSSGQGEVRIALSADALRRLAADLLDAADDIESHPAALLKTRSEVPA